ncbi:hypothetical protein QVD17_17062 [Tagetes erecta]|uniref:Uncharacterized protein n=1 Tax=Tagetes erecta TaxID=13708 RepID=A0AAD8KSH1_TARER|nr:hypothetical protein QVD17_17062 [Tagetes erecta]
MSQLPKSSASSLNRSSHPVATPVPASQFTLLKDLHPSRSNICIKVRVLRIWFEYFHYYAFLKTLLD